MTFNQLPANPFLRSNNMMLDAPATNFNAPMGERTTMFDNIAVLPNTFAMRKNSFYNPE
jgi:hypothetical protein